MGAPAVCLFASVISVGPAFSCGVFPRFHGLLSSVCVCVCVCVCVSWPLCSWLQCEPRAAAEG